MVWDEVLTNWQLESLLFYLETYGYISILRTHIQLDQNEGMRKKSPDKLKSILHLRELHQEREIPTEGLVLGISRLDHSKLGSEELTLAFEKIMGNQKRTAKNASDALLAVTSEFHGAFFISDDERLVKRTDKLRFRVIPFDCFEKWLCSLMGYSDSDFRDCREATATRVASTLKSVTNPKPLQKTQPAHPCNALFL
jgi:hypothetical protein